MLLLSTLLMFRGFDGHAHRGHGGGRSRFLSPNLSKRPVLSAVAPCWLTAGRQH